MKKNPLTLVALSACLLLGAGPGAIAGEVTGWLNWRGPDQAGASAETGLPDKWELNGVNDLWMLPIAGRGTPVAAGDKIYVLGYEGEGANLREELACIQADTGKIIWKHFFNDFLDDVIYDRYAIGAPTIDAETGNIYVLTTAGILACFTADGKPVWEHSMMERFGRITTPNGRVGAPVIEDDLVIAHAVTGNWGGEGTPRDRYYAFDKKTGLQVWSASPGMGPPVMKDTSFSTPILAWDSQGRRVFYSGNGDGSLLAANARTGEPLWRFQLSKGGVNSSVVLHNGKLIGIHGEENIDTPHAGRIVAVNVNAKPVPGDEGLSNMPKEAEVWRNNELVMFTSSPTLAGNRIYQVDQTGVLFCLDAQTGKILWKKKLGPDQIHASALYADGKLYVPMNNGAFWILKVSDAGAEELAKVKLDGNCLGQPAAWNGKVFVFTNKNLYAFGKKGNNPGVPAARPAEKRPAPGAPVALQIVPSETTLTPGSREKFTVYGIDDKGFRTGVITQKVQWAKWIPPTAKVKAQMDADFNDANELVAAPAAKLSAGAFEAAAGKLIGHIRGRVLSNLPINIDFESFTLDQDHATDKVKFAFPPLPWNGARFRWEIREKDGSKVLAKTLDNVLFQRAMTFVAFPNLSNYTVEADLMSEGGRRGMSEVGLINQRYIIELKGNHQELEVNSTQERVKTSVPFKWDPNTWYRLKTRVDVAADGSGVVRAKCWKRGDAEPSDWTIQVPHDHAHTHGSPGVFGFAPLSQFRVFIDNLSVTANK